MLNKLAVLLILLFVLVGCSNNDDKEVTITICEIDSVPIDNNQNLDIQIDGNGTTILEAVGDHVVRMEEINRMDVEGFSEILGMSKAEFLRWWEEDEEFVREVFKDTIEVSISGMTTEIDITDEYFIIKTIKIFDEMSLAELEYFTGQPVSFVSLSEAIETIEIYLEGICMQQ